MEREWRMEDWIVICDFLEDRKSKIVSGLTFFQDWRGIQDKSGHRGLIFFEDWESKIRIVMVEHTLRIRVGYVLRETMMRVSIRHWSHQH